MVTSFPARETATRLQCNAAPKTERTTDEKMSTKGKPATDEVTNETTNKRATTEGGKRVANQEKGANAMENYKTSPDLLELQFYCNTTIIQGLTKKSQGYKHQSEYFAK